MFAKSDVFILVVSASLLAVGIYRWQNSLSPVSPNAQQAQAQQLIPASNATVISAIAPNNVQSQTTIPSVTGVQTSGSSGVSNSVTSVSIVVSNNNVPTSTPVITSNSESNEPLLGSYTVIYGDYLSKIAQRYGTSVQRLQAINNLDGTVIKVGQTIQFPLPAN